MRAEMGRFGHNGRCHLSRTGGVSMSAVMMLLIASVGPLNGPLPPGAIAQLGTAKFDKYDHGAAGRLTSVEYSGPGELIMRPGAGRVRKWDIATGKSTPLPPSSPSESGQALSRDGR